MSLLVVDLVLILHVSNVTARNAADSVVQVRPVACTVLTEVRQKEHS